MNRMLRDEIKRDEGVRKDAYRDGNGHWTIGAGHLIDLDPERKIAVPRITRITDREVDAFLDYDIADAIHIVLRVFPSLKAIMVSENADGVRGRALINMAFNRGESRMQKSTTITPAIKAALLAEDHGMPADWGAVGEAIRRSPWAKQIGDRAERLARAFETGEPQ